MNRPRGTGSVFQFNGAGNWWIKYHRNGKPVRENSHSPKVKDAERLLKQRMGEIEAGIWTGPKLAKIMMSELAEDMMREYRINRRKSARDLEIRWRLHLNPFFGSLRAAQVSSDLVGKYIDQRQAQGAENGTINRELAALKRMFSLGRRATPPKVKDVPYIAMLKENNVRKGFLRDEQYDELAAEAGKEGLWMRGLLSLAYNFGWRKSEMLGLRVSQVDLADRTIRLESGETKNDHARSARMPEELCTLISALIAGKAPQDFVFTRNNGKPVRRFSKLWANVCARAGVPGLLLHDLRRTGARNLRRLGIAESVCMQVTGHKTTSVFKRYDITDESDLMDVAARLDEKRRLQFGQSLGRNLAEAKDSGIPSIVPTSLPN